MRVLLIIFLVLGIIVFAFLIGTCMLCGHVAMKMNEQQVTDLAQLDSLKIEDFTWESANGYFTAKGRIRNGSTRPASFVKINLEFMDGAGKVVASNWTYAIDSSSLRPSAATGWEAMCRAEPGAKTAHWRLSR